MTHLQRLRDILRGTPAVLRELPHMTREDWRETFHSEEFWDGFNEGAYVGALVGLALLILVFALVALH